MLETRQRKTKELKDIMTAIQKSNLEQKFKSIALDAILKLYPPQIANKLLSKIRIGTK